MVKQEDEDTKHWVIDSVDSSRDKISADELDDMEDGDDRERKEEQPGMPGHQDNSNRGIMPSTNNAPPSHSPSRTVEQEDQDFDI